MDWDKLRVFHAVAEAGSFTHAGEKLNLSQSAVSRQISGLEDSLGTTLFHRHARGLILTEQGDLLFRTAREMFAKMSMVQAQLSESKERPSGQLTITTTIGFGSAWLTPKLTHFLTLYPDISVNLILEDGELDLAMREADVAIRMTLPKQADLIQRPLMTVHTHLYASPSYVKANGTPGSIEDLDHHKLICYGNTHPPYTNINWVLDIGKEAKQKRAPAFQVNNIPAMRAAVKAGIGIAALPEFLVQDDTDLVHILPEIEGDPIKAYFVYPEELRASKRISVFRDFLLQKVAESHF